MYLNIVDRRTDVFNRIRTKFVIGVSREHIDRDDDTVFVVMQTNCLV